MLKSSSKILEELLGCLNIEKVALYQVTEMIEIITDALDESYKEGDLKGFNEGYEAAKEDYNVDG